MVEAFPEVLTEEQLDAVLAGTDDAEVRAALRERLLAEQFRAQAMLASDVPVAAQIVSPPTPSPGPCWRSPAWWASSPGFS